MGLRWPSQKGIIFSHSGSSPQNKNSEKSHNIPINIPAPASYSHTDPPCTRSFKDQLYTPSYHSSSPYRCNYATYRGIWTGLGSPPVQHVDPHCIPAHSAHFPRAWRICSPSPLRQCSTSASRGPRHLANKIHSVEISLANISAALGVRQLMTAQGYKALRAVIL